MLACSTPFHPFPIFFLKRTGRPGDAQEISFFPHRTDFDRQGYSHSVDKRRLGNMLQGFPGEFPLRGNGFLVGSALSIEGAAQYELDIPQSRKLLHSHTQCLYQFPVPLARTNTKHPRTRSHRKTTDCVPKQLAMQVFTKGEPVGYLLKYFGLGGS